MTIRFHPSAEAELNEITERYEERRPGLGSEFADEIESALELVEATPEAWPL